MVRRVSRKYNSSKRVRSRSKSLRKRVRSLSKRVRSLRKRSMKGGGCSGWSKKSCQKTWKENKKTVLGEADEECEYYPWDTGDTVYDDYGGARSGGHVACPDYCVRNKTHSNAMMGACKNNYDYDWSTELFAKKAANEKAAAATATSATMW